MTSEICVANRRALVLAADSAVTVTSWDQGQKRERYFKGANKIFQLSTYQPIGLMIYDTADLHRVPWEIIVKEYREQLGRAKCGDLKDYADHFFKFIEDNTNIFPADLRKSIFVETIDQGMVRVLSLINDDPGVKAAGSDAVALQQAQANAFQGFLTGSKTWIWRFNVTESDVDQIKQDTLADLQHEATIDINIFGNGGNYPVDELIDIAVRLVFCFDFLQATGIVIAGYGDNEYFPSYFNYDCKGLINNTILRESSGSFGITTRAAGHINSFATTAMIDTFTMGFGPDVLASVQTNLTRDLKDFAQNVCAAAGVAVPVIDHLISDAVTLHRDHWTEDVIKNHAQPLTSVIGSLPIDEMANLAETLVMLESLKEKVTQPSESVGGPIDVAIITKAEGFVWAKRKHFFNAELNPRYMWRQQESYKQSP